MPTQAVHDDPHNAQGAVPFGFDENPPTTGPTNKYPHAEPDPPAGYDVDFEKVAPVTPLPPIPEIGVGPLLPLA